MERLLNKEPIAASPQIAESLRKMEAAVKRDVDPILRRLEEWRFQSSKKYKRYAASPLK